MQDILYQILRGLAYLHKKNIIHRDIKLENLFFEETMGKKYVKIIDFGISR